MQKKLLKTSLFGFSKVEVCEYIARVNDEFNEKVDRLTAERIQEKNGLLAQIAALTEELEQYKKANGDIAQALFDAQQYAAALKAKADDEYATARDELLAFKNAETDKLNGYRDEIERVRKDVVALLTEIEGKMIYQIGDVEDLVGEYNSEEGIAV